MSQDLVVRKQDSVLTVDLAELGREALAAHERVRQCAVEAVENMVRAGQLLCKARELCDTRTFDDFIADHFGGKRRTAQTYMKLTRNWHRLQAAAPPEALTSQRKALRALDKMLADQEPSNEQPRRRKRRRAAGTPGPAAPSNADFSPDTAAGSAAPPPAPTIPADDKRQIAVQAIYRQLMQLLTELRQELSQSRPGHYLVRWALERISEKRSRFEQVGRELFEVVTPPSGASVRASVERLGAKSASGDDS